VTEADWLAGSNPIAMLSFLRGRVSDRKLRLYACACCRCIWNLLRDQRSRTAIELAERFADGAVSCEDFQTAVDAASTAHDEAEERAREDDYCEDPSLAASSAAQAAYYATGAAAGSWPGKDIDTGDALAHIVGEAAEYARCAVESAALALDRGDRTAWADAAVEQCALLHDLFGNPFQPVPFAEHWRTADTVGIATAIYEETAFDRLPVLADALEDAGCTHPDILEHCRRRAGGLHVRGCWVLDLVLGKM
jgi:hypothetical protein